MRARMTNLLSDSLAFDENINPFVSSTRILRTPNHQTSSLNPLVDNISESSLIDNEINKFQKNATSANDSSDFISFKRDSLAGTRSKRDSITFVAKKPLQERRLSIKDVFVAVKENEDVVDAALAVVQSFRGKIRPDEFRTYIEKFRTPSPEVGLNEYQSGDFKPHHCVSSPREELLGLLETPKINRNNDNHDNSSVLTMPFNDNNVTAVQSLSPLLCFDSQNTVATCAESTNPIDVVNVNAPIDSESSCFLPKKVLLRTPPSKVFSLDENSNSLEGGSNSEVLKDGEDSNNSNKNGNDCDKNSISSRITSIENNDENDDDMPEMIPSLDLELLDDHTDINISHKEIERMEDVLIQLQSVQAVSMEEAADGMESAEQLGSHRESLLPISSDSFHASPSTTFPKTSSHCSPAAVATSILSSQEMQILIPELSILLHELRQLRNDLLEIKSKKELITTNEVTVSVDSESTLYPIKESSTTSQVENLDGNQDGQFATEELEVMDGIDHEISESIESNEKTEEEIVVPSTVTSCEDCNQVVVAERPITPMEEKDPYSMEIEALKSSLVELSSIRQEIEERRIQRSLVCEKLHENVLKVGLGYPPSPSFVSLTSLSNQMEETVAEPAMVTVYPLSMPEIAYENPSPQNKMFTSNFMKVIDMSTTCRPLPRRISVASPAQKLKYYSSTSFLPSKSSSFIPISTVESAFDRPQFNSLATQKVMRCEMGTQCGDMNTSLTNAEASYGDVISSPKLDDAHSLPLKDLPSRRSSNVFSNEEEEDIQIPVTDENLVNHDFDMELDNHFDADDVSPVKSEISNIDASQIHEISMGDLEDDGEQEIAMNSSRQLDFDHCLGSSSSSSSSSSSASVGSSNSRRKVLSTEYSVDHDLKTRGTRKRVRQSSTSTSESASASIREKQSQWKKTSKGEDSSSDLPIDNLPIMAKSSSMAFVPVKGCSPLWNRLEIWNESQPMKNPLKDKKKKMSVEANDSSKEMESMNKKNKKSTKSLTSSQPLSSQQQQQQQQQQRQYLAEQRAELDEENKEEEDADNGNDDDEEEEEQEKVAVEEEDRLMQKVDSSLARKSSSRSKMMSQETRKKQNRKNSKCVNDETDLEGSLTSSTSMSTSLVRPSVSSTTVSTATTTITAASDTVTTVIKNIPNKSNSRTNRSKKTLSCDNSDNNQVIETEVAACNAPLADQIASSQEISNNVCVVQSEERSKSSKRGKKRQLTSLMQQDQVEDEEHAISKEEAATEIAASLLSSSNRPPVSKATSSPQTKKARVVTQKSERRRIQGSSSSSDGSMNSKNSKNSKNSNINPIDDIRVLPQFSEVSPVGKSAHDEGNDIVLERDISFEEELVKSSYKKSKEVRHQDNDQEHFQEDDRKPKRAKKGSSSSNINNNNSSSSSNSNSNSSRSKKQELVALSSTSSSISSLPSSSSAAAVLPLESRSENNSISKSSFSSSLTLENESFPSRHAVLQNSKILNHSISSRASLDSNSSISTNRKQFFKLPVLKMKK